MRHARPPLPMLRYIPHPTYIPVNSTPKHMPKPKSGVKHFALFQILPGLNYGSALNTYEFAVESTHWGYEISNNEVLLLGPVVQDNNLQDFVIVPRLTVLKSELDYHNIYTGFDDPRYLAVLQGEPFQGIHPRSIVA